MQEIKQSTEIKVRIGAAVDATDGVTPETTLALGTADQAELLKHNGVATVDISARTFAAITACDGWYDLTLTTADSDTLGMATVVIQDSSLMAPIFKDFMVVTANYWDSKYGTDKLEVDLLQMGGVAQSATDLKDFADDGYTPGTHKVNGVVLVDTSATLTDLGATAKTSVNTEMVDVMTLDTIAEPSQGAMPVAPTFAEAIKYLYFRMRNKTETTAGEDSVYDDVGTTKLFKATISDDGTTFTKAEYISGV
jgi:hypothetical protein